MADEFTSTEGSKQYVVRFEPGGERIIVNAGNAVAALALGRGIAEMLDIDHNGGIDTFPAEEGDIDHPDNVYPAPIPDDEVEEMKLAQEQNLPEALAEIGDINAMLDAIDYPDPEVTYVEPTNQLGDEEE